MKNLIKQILKEEHLHDKTDDRFKDMLGSRVCIPNPKNKKDVVCGVLDFAGINELHDEFQVTISRTPYWPVDPETIKLQVVKEEKGWEWAKDTLDNPFKSQIGDKKTHIRSVMKVFGISREEAIQLMAQYQQPKEKFKHEYDKDTTYWSPGSGSSTYQFKYPPKWNSLTRKFVDWVRWNPGTTAREFYENVFPDKKFRSGGYKSSYNSMFFGSIKDSGIVEAKIEKGKNKYYLGPNYEAWTQGKLKRYMGDNIPDRLRY